MRSTSITTLGLMVLGLGLAGFAQRPANTTKPPTALPSSSFSCLNRIEAADWTVMLADVRATNPAGADRLANDPAMRQRQVDSLRELLAYSCQAVKDGISADARNSRELNNIRREVTATNYDKAKYPAPDHELFSAITPAQVAAFTANKANDAVFDQFLQDKLSILKDSDPSQANRVPTPDEIQEAKKIFAKVNISEAAFAREAATMAPTARRRVELQVALQQAQFLAKLYTDKIADQLDVSDAEVASYITKHPELQADKRAKANDVLQKAKAGESFAALADRFSEDPGNMSPNGTKQGGLYQDVPKGRMIKAFEAAALSLKPGEVYPQVVETEFGYHVIKLEKVSGTGDGLTYDVRHVLLATTVKDPENPMGRDLPLADFVHNKLQSDKENAIIAKVLLDNPIAIAPFPVTAATKPAGKTDH